MKLVLSFIITALLTFFSYWLFERSYIFYQQSNWWAMVFFMGWAVVLSRVSLHRIVLVLTWLELKADNYFNYSRWYRRWWS